MSLSSESIIKETTGTYSLDQPCSRVEVCGESGEFVILGGRKYHREDLTRAFAGTFQVERYLTGPTHSFANPAPVGLAGFGLTTVVLGLFIANAKHIHQPQLIVGCCMFAGGVLLFLSGTWELVMGNTFGGTAFVSYGTFWFSFGAITIPGFGIAEAYGEDADQLNQAIGHWLLGWVMFTLICWAFTLKATWAFFITFTFLEATFVVLMAGYYSGLANVMKGGGILAVITGFMGWFCGYAGIANRSNTYSFFIPPSLPMPLIGKKG